MSEKKKDYVPAPGEYDIKSKIIEGPQYSILKKREDKIPETVGPGQYEAQEFKTEGVTIGK